MDPQQLTEEQRKELEEKLKNMSPEELLEFQKQQCIFCQIIAGKIPAKRVYEDDACIAVLDINPAAKGHLLILPKEHYAIMPQIPEKEINHLFLTAKNMSKLLLKSLKVSGTNIFVANGLAAGQKAQHFMIHVIPRKEDDGVLHVEDKLIDEETRKKVKALIENKFNELMGVKKEIVEVEEKEEEKVVKKKAKKKKEELEEKEQGPEEESEEVEEKEEKIEDIDEESEDEQEENDEDIEEQTEDKEPEEDDEDNKQDNDKKDDNTSLDDIANLFK